MSVSLRPSAGGFHFGLGCHARAARACLAVALLLLAASSPVCAAAPVVDRFFPAGVARGGEVQVQALGRFDAWPPKTWTSQPGLSISALAKPGQLLVRASSDTEPGIHWVRLYDAAGASEPRPLVVGTLAELNDREPNDTWRAAQLLEHAACTINGRLAEGDCDVFAVYVHVGQTLVAWIEAERSLGSPMDGVLQILDPQGTMLAQNHDFNGLDPCAAVQAGADGVYFVRLFAFPAKPNSKIQLAGGDDFVYRLTVTSQAAINYAFPLSVNKASPQSIQLRGWNLSPDQQAMTLQPQAGREALVLFRPHAAGYASLRVEECATQIEQEPNPPQRANKIRLPICISGTIGEPRDEDAYSFSADDGQTVDFRLESAALGFPLDAVLSLADSDGNVVATADDNEGRRDPELMYTVALGGEYRLTVRDLYGHGSWRHAYRLRGDLAAPDFAIKLGSATWSTTTAGQLDLPVAIERRNSCDATIRLAITGLPASAECAARESRPGEASAGNVTLKITAGNTPFAGPIQIIGTTDGEHPTVRRAHAEIEGFSAKTDQFWLTIAAPNSAQRKSTE